MIQLVKFTKDFLLFLPFTLIFQPLSKFFLFVAHFNKLILWIRENKKQLLYCDFYTPVRNYDKRFEMFLFLIKTYNLNTQPVTYLEFGVSTGASFKWWLKQNTDENSRFFGFDTFEGLPENWGGFYKKGDMISGIPQIDDARGEFIKGLFQETLNPFIEKHAELLRSNRQKIIHMDADLYSATAFALSQIAPFLKAGDVVLFDEFSVPMHEFKAYSEFVANFSVKLKPVASVNNFYQTAFVVE